MGRLIAFTTSINENLLRDNTRADHIRSAIREVVQRFCSNGDRILIMVAKLFIAINSIAGAIEIHEQAVGLSGMSGVGVVSQSVTSSGVSFRRTLGHFRCVVTRGPCSL